MVTVKVQGHGQSFSVRLRADATLEELKQKLSERQWVRAQLDREDVLAFKLLDRSVNKLDLCRLASTSPLDSLGIRAQIQTWANLEKLLHPLRVR